MRHITLVFLCLLLATPALAAKTKPAPVLEDGALLAWATGTATQSLTFSYSDYQQVFKAEQKNFTPAGWREFHAAQASTLKDVIKHKQLVSTETAKAPHSPLIKSKGLKKGTYQWVVTVPVVETVWSGKKRISKKISVTMTIGIVKNYPPLAGQSSLRVLRWSEPGQATKNPVKKKPSIPAQAQAPT